MLCIYHNTTIANGIIAIGAYYIAAYIVQHSILFLFIRLILQQ
jgi:hypothetical protein